MNWTKFLTSIHGRIGRQSYWVFFVLAFIGGAALGVLDAVLFPTQEEGVLSRVFGLALIWPGFCVQGKRLHDLGRSAWFMLAPYGGMLLTLPLFAVNASVGMAAIVLVVLAFYAWVGFFKGAPGPNKYGEPNSGDRDIVPVVEVFT